MRRHPRSTLFPYTTLFRSYEALKAEANGGRRPNPTRLPDWTGIYTRARGGITYDPDQPRGGPPTAKLTPEYQARLTQRIRSEEHTSELQSLAYLVCRLLLE